MRRLNLVLLIGLFLPLAACGKSEEQKAAEKAAEETREAAEALQKAAESAGASGTAEGLKEFAKAMEGMAGAMSGTDARWQAGRSRELSGLADGSP